MIADVVFLAACAAAAVLLGLYAPKLRQQWRNAQGVIELTEREGQREALENVATCENCSDPSGMGWCTCPIFCGHRLCRGRRVQARWSPNDMDVLAGDLTSIKREGQW